jgi:hypothetical protein
MLRTSELYSDIGGDHSRKQDPRTHQTTGDTMSDLSAASGVGQSLTVAAEGIWGNSAAARARSAAANSRREMRLGGGARPALAGPGAP